MKQAELNAKNSAGLPEFKTEGARMLFFNQLSKQFSREFQCPVYVRPARPAEGTAPAIIRQKEISLTKGLRTTMHYTMNDRYEVTRRVVVPRRRHGKAVEVLTQMARGADEVIVSVDFHLVEDYIAVTSRLPSPPRPRRPKPLSANANRPVNVKQRQRALVDPAFRTNRAIRGSLICAIRANKQGRKWESILGYTLKDLRAHLAERFAPGMSWSNYGEWHIDHVKPLSLFKITGLYCPVIKEAWALSNLQPLWAKDNIRKGARWEG